MAPLPRNLFEVCPTARLQFVHVAYGWDIQRAQYVEVYSASYALTRSQPTMAWPAQRTVPNSNFCGEVDIILATGRPVARTIPRSVQDSAEANSAAVMYLQKSALAYPKSVRLYAYNTIDGHQRLRAFIAAGMSGYSWRTAAEFSLAPIVRSTSIVIRSALRVPLTPPMPSWAATARRSPTTIGLRRRSASSRLWKPPS